MHKHIADMWIEDLENNAELQGQFRLHSESADGKVGYCCLGRLCAIAVREGVIPAPVISLNIDNVRVYGTAYEYDGEAVFLPNAVREWAGMDSSSGRLIQANYCDLTEMNDEGQSFYTIANTIADQWETL